jgi:hypothetical protein
MAPSPPEPAAPLVEHFFRREASHDADFDHGLC